VLLAVGAAALTQRRNRMERERSWNARATTALTGVSGLQTTFARPSSLDPGEQQAFRGAVASARDYYATFQQLAETGPSQEASQEAGEVGDQLRVLATTTEVELEGLSNGALGTVEAREKAEATRQTDVTALNQSINRLSTTMGVPPPGQSPGAPAPPA
jgi:hypothetical protein